MREVVYRLAWALLDALAMAALHLTRAAAGLHLRVQWAQARLVGWQHRRRRRGGVWL
ncbi:MAG: hypothetical protein DIU70_003725 [Bacillota bacterium]